MAEKTKKYKIEVTEEQLKALMIFSEEYLRLRLNQWDDFVDDIIHNTSGDSSDNFDLKLERKLAAKKIFEATFTVAVNERVYATSTGFKSDMSLIAHEFYQVIRNFRYLQMPEEKQKLLEYSVASSKPLSMSGRPLPKIETVESEDADDD